jgi:hypothetical protein
LYAIDLNRSCLQSAHHLGPFSWRFWLISHLVSLVEVSMADSRSEFQPSPIAVISELA